MTSAELGSLNKLLNTFRREDLLDFGDGKRIKKMKVALWNISTNSPDLTSVIPKLWRNNIYEILTWDKK